MKCESETFELRKCVSATMSYKKREIYLDRVDGAPFGCPSAAITLKYAEGFAKSFGAIIVKLFDASSYWLFRSIPEEIEPNIIVYAKLFTGLKNGIVEPYYQKHGYSFLSATFNETVQQSVDLIGSLTTNELRNSLSRCEVCVQANEALSNFDGVFREVFQDLHIVAESGDIEAQITLYQIFMIFVSYDAFKNFKQGSNVRTAVKNIVSSECEVEDAHYMIKRLDV